MKFNRIIIILLSLILSISIAFSAVCFSKDDAPILNEVYGKYVMDEYLYAVESMVLSSFPDEDYTFELTVQEDKIILQNNNKIERYRTREIPVKDYRVVKITDEIRNNGVTSQGVVLCSGIMPFDKKDELMKNSYAIFTKEPKQPGGNPPNIDSCVIYYIDGTVYWLSSRLVFRMKKID